MRYLGIDYGTKKIGLAVSDESGSMAFPHSVIPNNSETLTAIETLIEREGIASIVIGHSLNTDGVPNQVQTAIESCITDLTLNTGLPVHLEPEYYTTQEAIRFQGRGKLTDASAAAIILNSFLSKHHG